MTMTDPIADMLTRLRNANSAHKEFVDAPKSKMTLELTRLLKREGFIDDFKFVDLGNRSMLRIFLKYAEDGETVIKGLKRISKPGCREYTSAKEAPLPFGGLGIGILSTSKGLMTGKQCRKEKIGGEVLCHVW